MAEVVEPMACKQTGLWMIMLEVFKDEGLDILSDLFSQAYVSKL